MTGITVNQAESLTCFETNKRRQDSFMFTSVASEMAPRHQNPVKKGHQ